MDSDEMKKMLEQYPDNRKTNIALARNRVNVNHLWNQCNQLLATEPVKLDI